MNLSKHNPQNAPAKLQSLDQLLDAELFEFLESISPQDETMQTVKDFEAKLIERLKLGAKHVPKATKTRTPDPKVVDYYTTTFNSQGESLAHVCIRKNLVKTFTFIINSGCDCDLSSTSDISLFSYCLLFHNQRLLLKLYKQSTTNLYRKWMLNVDRILESCHHLIDFRLGFHWKFTSWIPFLSSVTPSDDFLITKIGDRLCLKATLIGYSGFRPQRGEIVLLFNPITSDLDEDDVQQPSQDSTTKNPTHQLQSEEDYPSFESPPPHAKKTFKGDLFLINHTKKVYSSLIEHLLEPIPPGLIGSFMEVDDQSIEFDMKNASFSKYSGWFRSGNKVISGFKTQPYNLKNLNVKLITREFKDRDGSRGQTRAQLRKNLQTAIKTKPKKSAKSNKSHSEQETLSPEEQKKLESDLSKSVSQLKTDLLANSNSTTEPLPEPRQYKTSTRSLNLSAHLQMSKDFPILISDLIPILKAFVPISKYFNIILEFLSQLNLLETEVSSKNQNLHPGFPVQVEIPLLASVKILMLFHDVIVVKPNDDIYKDTDQFRVPKNYTKVRWYQCFFENPHSRSEETTSTTSTSNSDSG